ncbi:glutamyl-tRNA reductase [Paenibacillus thermoaerophilus]|uniref:Glutamyl-tRNA reductase n=1 Tax=Paenibacillus thermoaerophilus TaxID=1215385 RepID=A0ABW2V353_9BACL|nr:glutamyl-tRNA reductase [Paenibacillus thermoaerophilus]TMV11086.1 glutamyl-tRNA reductase [Paenibacillus thermoaerophilus]
MHVLAVGLNYRTAPVEIREKFAIAPEQLPEALEKLKATKSVMECVIVGTCNRMEIYAVVDRLYMCGAFIRGFMEKWFGVPRADIAPFLYIYEDERAVEHLFRVTCGLDSMVLGETQILGQVRSAFLTAQAEGTTGTMFNTIFKQAITLAKRAHAETGIGENPVSVSYAAVELGKQIFGDYKGKTVLIIGAGKMGELTIKHLRAGGADRVLVVNRTLSRAEDLAAKVGGQAVPWSRLEEALADSDVVISSTGAEGLVLSASQVKRATARRAGRQLFMIDIAVPRDLDPAIGELSDVFLYDIDDLQQIVDGNLAERRKQSLQIEGMIASELEAYRQWLKMLGVTPLIRALQEKSHMIFEETMDDLDHKLPGLSDHERKLIRKLTKSIVNQMLKDPILRIKEMAGEKGSDEALRIFTELFALEQRVAELEAEMNPAKAARASSSAQPVQTREAVTRRTMPLMRSPEPALQS